MVIQNSRLIISVIPDLPHTFCPSKFPIGRTSKDDVARRSSEEQTMVKLYAIRAVVDHVEGT